MIENDYNKPISDINQIELGPGLIPKNRDEFENIVEKPCLPACLFLYDRNIRTIESSCNNVNNSYAFITIDYNSLSEENRQVLKQLVEEGIIQFNLEEQIREIRERAIDHIKMEYECDGINFEEYTLEDLVELSNINRGMDPYFLIKLKITENSTVGMIQDKFMQIVSRFQEQDVLYGRITRDKIEALVEQYGNKFTIEELAESFGYVYDEELDIYWENQELYNKHKQYQEKQKKVLEDKYK